MNYAILELPEGAPIEDVKKAYKRLALKYHPDKNPGTEEKFKQISEAYQAIIEPAQVQNVNQASNHHVNPHDIFQHFFSMNPGFNVHQGFNVHTGFNTGFNVHPGMTHTQHSTSIQNGKKIEVIIRTENGQTTKQTIVTDLETNSVTITPDGGLEPPTT